MSQLTADRFLARLLEDDLYYVDVETAAGLTGLGRRSAQDLLTTLHRRGLAQRVKRGEYLLVGHQPERILSQPYFIAVRAGRPAYISYRSALHLHGLTEQVPRVVYVATTKKRQRLSLDGLRIRFVRQQPRHFFGYVEGGTPPFGYSLAEAEKTVLDSLYLPTYGGGLEEVFKALVLGRDSLAEDRLHDYARRLGSRALAARLGYLMELAGYAPPDLPMPGRRVWLDPLGPKEGAGAQKWPVLLNLPPERLLEALES